MNNFSKNLALWVIIGLLLIALFNLFQNPSSRGPQTSLAFSDFLAEVDNGRISDVTIQGKSISGHFSDGRSFSTYAPDDPTLVSRLSERGVRITAQPLDDNMPSLLGVLVSWFPKPNPTWWFAGAGIRSRATSTSTARKSVTNWDYAI